MEGLLIAYPIVPYDASFEAKYETKILMKELVKQYPDLENFSLKVAPSGFKGLILVDLREALVEVGKYKIEAMKDFIRQLYETKRENGDLRYLLKLIILDYLVETDSKKIFQKVASYRDIIQNKWRLKVKSRGILPDKKAFIEEVAEAIDAPVDLENPVFIIHIEILGELTGIYLEIRENV